MISQTIIPCAFCRGRGENPHFTGICPVCKGEGENQIRGEFMACRDCRGSGQKRGTTLTCYTCGGLGVVPDTREEFRRAREEIKEVLEEMEKERPARQRPEPHPPASSREASRAGAIAGGEEFREKIENLKSALPADRAEAKSPPDPPAGRAGADRSREGGMESAIGSYCEDCALGENRECWDIECALAPFSSVAERNKSEI